MTTKNVNLKNNNQTEEDGTDNIENIEKIQEAFDCFDRNKSGRILTRVKRFIGLGLDNILTEHRICNLP